MAPSYSARPRRSAGGEALNILQPKHLKQLSTTDYLHNYSRHPHWRSRTERVRRCPAFVNVPTKELTSRGFSRRNAPAR